MSGAKLIGSRVLKPLVQDAATFITQELVEKILNGETGLNYPKTYPGSVREGASGFVGVVTSNLRRSIGIQNESELVVIVRQIDSQIAPYHDRILEWSREKYGLSFYQIAIRLYGAEVAQTIVRVIVSAVRQIGRGQFPRYVNKFR